jgi:hypothetical protein
MDNAAPTQPFEREALPLNLVSKLQAGMHFRQSHEPRLKPISD